jgi:rod shape-determining protein MreC
VATEQSTGSRFVVGVVVLSSLTLLALNASLSPARGQVKSALRPARSMGLAVTAPIRNAVGQKLNYTELVKENARLRKELAIAQADSLRAADAVRERKQLLAFNKFRDPDGFKSKSARVVSLGGNNFEDKAEIDIGSSDGIAVGDPVVTEAGLVGRVVKVYATSADVALVTDPDISVGVRFAKSGEVGLATGQEPKASQQILLIRVKMVALDSKPEVGDILVTSGLEKSTFPPALPVAKIKSIKVGAIDFDIVATPIVDLKRLGFVKVLVGRR